MSAELVLAGVTIVRLTHLNPGPAGERRWLVLLSDGTEARTWDGPVAYSIGNAANAGRVDVTMRGDRIVKVTPSAPARPRRRRP